MTSIKGGAKFPTTPIARLTGHGGPVHAVTYSATTAQYILTGSTDRLIRLYNPATASPPAAPPSSSSITSSPPPPPTPAAGKNAPRPAGLVQTYAGHAHAVLAVAVSPDNARLASGGGDRAVLAWDVAGAAVVRRLEGHGARVNDVAWGADGGVVVSGSLDATVKMWDMRAQGGKAMMTLAEARDSVSCVGVVGVEIWAGSVDGRVRVYDVRMGAVSVDVIGNSVTSVMPTGRNDAYLVSTLDSRMRLMDKASGKLLQTFESDNFANMNYRLRSTLAANDSIALSGTEDGRILAWDILEGRVVHEMWHDLSMKGATASNRSVISTVLECSTREEWCSAGGDGVVVVWGHSKKAS